MHTLADLRQDYSKASLDVSSLETNPILQFEKWFNEALRAEVLEPNAMSLATINADHRPSSRIVLLKGIDNGKFVFYTNLQSDKGRELENNPACAATFFWPELERQVRIEGTATRVDESKAQEYFQSRPRASQIGAWSSPQSSVLESREILEARVRQMEQKFEGQTVLPKPHQWGGFQIEPFLIEFWQGRRSRLHDRMEFVKTDGAWKVHRLAP